MVHKTQCNVILMYPPVACKPGFYGALLVSFRSSSSMSVSQGAALLSCAMHSVGGGPACIMRVGIKSVTCQWTEGHFYTPDRIACAVSVW